MKIGDEVYVHGFVDEIRNNMVIIRNTFGYFGTAEEEVRDIVRCKDCKHWQDQEEGVVESAICIREKPMVMEIGPYGHCSYGERRSE